MSNLKVIEEWRKVIEGRNFTKEEASKHFNALRKASKPLKNRRFDSKEVNK
jgi:hypothetical protein